LTGIAKDANSTQDAGCLTSTNRGWLPLMKYMEYIVEITETVISPEVAFKSRFY